MIKASSTNPIALYPTKTIVAKISSGSSKLLKLTIKAPRIAAITKTIPPIVGVPFFDLCDSSPSSRST